MGFLDFWIDDITTRTIRPRKPLFSVRGRMVWTPILDPPVARLGPSPVCRVLGKPCPGTPWSL